MTAEDRYHVKRGLSRADRHALSAKYQCNCRVDWGKGREKCIHYLRIHPNGSLIHHTVCDSDYHKLKIRNQYVRDNIEACDLMKERKKNVKLWQRLKAARQKKVSDYAKKHGISHMKATWELEWFDMLDQEEYDAMRIESEPYIPVSVEEE